jgi:hypothetical protein
MAASVRGFGSSGGRRLAEGNRRLVGVAVDDIHALPDEALDVA